jgi:fibronectin type 3 domain-containing protein
VGGYIIYRGLNTTKMKQIVKVKDYQSHSYMDKGTNFERLKDGQDYYYALSSFNTYGAEGEHTAAFGAKTKPVPGPVSGFKTVAKNDYIYIQWDQSSEEDILHYTLYHRKDEGRWVKLNKFQNDKLYYEDYDLKPEAYYYYRIIAEDEDGLKSEPVESTSTLSPIKKAEQ